MNVILYFIYLCQCQVHILGRGVLFCNVSLFLCYTFAEATATPAPLLAVLERTGLDSITSVSHVLL